MRGMLCPPSLVKPLQLAGWVDARRIKLAGIPSGPCDDYKVPATLMVLSQRAQAKTCQSWLANVAFRFTPVEIPAAAERAPAAAGIKRERDAPADEEQAAGSAAAGEAGEAAEAAEAANERQAKCVKLKHDNQGGWTDAHNCRLLCQCIMQFDSPSYILA